eukprot:jgi/Bigna1/138713/aug1.46_g13421
MHFLSLFLLILPDTVEGQSSDSNQQTTGATPPFICDAWQTYLQQVDRQRFCFSQAEKGEIGIVPVNREGASFSIEYHAHPSVRILAMMTAIVGEELMGYSTSYVCARSGVNAAARIANGYTDLLLEYQYSTLENELRPYIQEQSVIDAGPIGYTSQAAFYIPEYMKTYLTGINFGNTRLNSYIQASYDSYLVYRDFAEVVNFLARQNDTLAVKGLTMLHSFTPPWCTPYSPDGSTNNCIDVKAEQISLDQGIMQQMIINLRMPFTMSWWGNEGLTAILTQKVTNGLPYIAKAGYLPPNYLGVNAPRAVRMLFPPYSEACYANNTGSLNGAGSIDCDFPLLQLRKLANPRILDNGPKSPFRDLSKFVRQVSISKSELDFMWVDSYICGNYSACNDWVTACNFLKQNTHWRSWAQSTYEAPTRLDWTLQENSKIVVSSLSNLGIAICVIISILLVVYRDADVIRAISRAYSLLTLVGIAITIASAQLFTINAPTKSQCTAQLWIPPLGITVALSALGAKTYRIYRIFTMTLDNRSLISDFALFRYAASAWVMTTVALGIVQALAPPNPKEVILEENNTITTYRVCSFTTSAYFAVVAVLGFQVLIITKLAYDARSAPGQFNEAKELGLSMYTLVVSGLIGTPLISWFHSRREFDAFYTATGLLLTLPAAILIVFLYALRLAAAMFGFDFEDARSGTSTIDRTSRMANGSRSLKDQKSIRFANYSRSKKSVQITSVRVMRSNSPGPQDTVTVIRQESDALRLSSHRRGPSTFDRLSHRRTPTSSGHVVSEIRSIVQTNNGTPTVSTGASSSHATRPSTTAASTPSAQD